VTELGEQFILALADQGWGVIPTDEDVVVLSPDRRYRFHIPGVLFEDPGLELLLEVVIGGFILDFGFRWPYGDHGESPGMN